VKAIRNALFTIDITLRTRIINNQDPKEKNKKFFFSDKTELPEDPVFGA
jgi:hypothetical protein